MDRRWDGGKGARPEVTAAELKAKLYARHFASTAQMPGPWTCIEEWRGIDLLAFSAWSSVSGGRLDRIGYEVKVSRSDLRRELLNPDKRTANVAWCNQFYFAVPRGLLTADELAYDEPDWDPGDFLRTPCRHSRGGAEYPAWGASPGRCHKGKREALLVGPLPAPHGWGTDHPYPRYRPHESYRCDACGGKGHEGISRVERDAPTIWAPKDVGLIVVDGVGTHLVRKAPRRAAVPQLGPHELGQLVRFVSMRPDPRHQPRQSAAVA